MPGFVGSGAAMTAAAIDRFLGVVGAGAAEMWSVLRVETKGSGFLPDRRPRILFERHWFHAFTKGAYDASHPNISDPTAGGYEGGAAEYSRLADAIVLDRTSALKSASWGIGQVMGFNFAAAGFVDVEGMVDAMMAGEDAQLVAMAGFLEDAHLAAPLARHDWAAFARGYNGVAYAQHGYDTQLQTAYAAFAASLPDLRVREVQLLLTYQGFSALSVDGVSGAQTQDAIRLFQANDGLVASGEIDDALLEALRAVPQA